MFRCLSLDKGFERRYNNIAFNPGVAQLVARLVRDQEAVGSSPVTRTNVIAVSSEAAIFLFASLGRMLFLPGRGKGILPFNPLVF